MSNTTQAKLKNTKKTGHYVSSRYMQAAEKASAQSSEEKSTFLKSSREGKGYQTAGSSTQDSSSSKFSTSQDNHGMTSTPSSKGVMPLPPLDASAVTDVQGQGHRLQHLAVPHMKERIGPKAVDAVRRKITKKSKTTDESLQPCAPITATYKDKKNQKDKLLAAELDIHYAYYLQAAFLESEAKKSLEAKSSSATEILYKLSSLVQQHLHKVKTQKCSLKIISSLIEVHNHCQKQEDMLKAVFKIIPTLDEQYQNLAEAINATKHKLHVKNVLLPDCGSEEKILEILQYMTEFVTSFFTKIPNYEDIISTSDMLTKYVDSAQLITDALKRGLSLLVEARDLSFSEASLALGSKYL